MTKTIIGILLLMGPLFSGAQEVDNLNGFKYAMVETMFYSDDRIDIHGISVMSRQRLLALGIIVVAENEESWTEELVNNPCLLVDFRITAKDRALGRQKVVLEGFDCNRRKAISLIGYGNAETYTKSYLIALDNVFEDLLAVGYAFDPVFTTTVDQREVERIGIDLKEARKYLDGSNLDPVEGIYQTQQDMGVKEILIRKSEDQSGPEYKAIVLQSTDEVWSSGEVKGYFTKSSIPNVYDVLWSDEDKVEQETIGFIGQNGNLSIEVEKPDKTKLKIDYQKTYPNLTE